MFKDQSYDSAKLICHLSLDWESKGGHLCRRQGELEEREMAPGVILNVASTGLVTWAEREEGEDDSMSFSLRRRGSDIPRSRVALCRSFSAEEGGALVLDTLR